MEDAKEEIDQPRRMVVDIMEHELPVILTQEFIRIVLGEIVDYREILNMIRYIFKLAEAAQLYNTRKLHKMDLNIRELDKHAIEMENDKDALNYADINDMIRGMCDYELLIAYNEENRLYDEHEKKEELIEISKKVEHLRLLEIKKKEEQYDQYHQMLLE